MPYLVAARKLDVPVVGYVASWDHTVGKGVVSPHLRRYVVQNETMARELERYHGIDPRKISVTGWPQTDVYHHRRPREEYAALLARLGLDESRPLVLFAGNTPDNAPYEGRLVERLVRWWQESGAHERYALLFRPHPRDNRAGERFRAAAGVDGAAVQEPSYTDLEDLATLLQHAACVVANAGTVLLDAVVNDRPAVCVLFDEGARAGVHWADRNLAGDHYRRLAGSGAFLEAHDFDELTAAIDRSLADPGALAAERTRIAAELVGVVDGKAGERVVSAVAGALGAA
jgi:CDP-glycerol glycerophosphotransferase (TagB/SpsB family)